MTEPGLLRTADETAADGRLAVSRTRICALSTAVTGWVAFRRAAETDHPVGAAGAEVGDLRVRLLEPDVDQPFTLGPAPGEVEHPRGQVDAGDAAGPSGVCWSFTPHISSLALPPPTASRGARRAAASPANNARHDRGLQPSRMV
jgi:hypothetical protein